MICDENIEFPTNNGSSVLRDRLYIKLKSFSNVILLCIYMYETNAHNGNF